MIVRVACVDVNDTLVSFYPTHMVLITISFDER